MHLVKFSNVLDASAQPLSHDFSGTSFSHRIGLILAYIDAVVT